MLPATEIQRGSIGSAAGQGHIPPPSGGGWSPTPSGRSTTGSTSATAIHVLPFEAVEKEVLAR